MTSIVAPATAPSPTTPSAAIEPAHDDRHPMSFVAYLLVVLIIPALGLFVNGLATSSATWIILGAAGLAVTIIGSATIYSSLARRLHRSPLIPDASAEEKRAYLTTHGR